MKNVFKTENRKLNSTLCEYYFGKPSLSFACFLSSFFFSFFMKKWGKKTIISSIHQKHHCLKHILQMQARTYSLHKYVSQDNKHIIYKISLLQRLSPSNPRTFLTVHRCLTVYLFREFIQIYRKTLHTKSFF